MAYIQKIGLAKAPYRHLQSPIKEFALEEYTVPEKHLSRVKRMYDQSEIGSRYSAIEDFSLPRNERSFFKRGYSPTTAERSTVFFDIAPKLCEQAIRDILSDDELQTITHLITVSCTGLAAPGLEIILLENLNLPKNIQRNGINFMGCYAGFHALKLAKAICADQPDAQVLIADVELCTLHFQKEFTMDNVASTLLFADGAAAALVNNQAANSLYKLESFYTEVALYGKKDMTFNVGNNGFLMSLSSYIPTILFENIVPLLNNAIADKNEIDYWAIHPGGKKIISEIGRALDLSDADMAVSYAILKEYGNMSSATIFFVLEAMRKTISETGKKVFATGFGPGLTIESAILST